jgi:hypothetical protein
MHFLHKVSSIRNRRAVQNGVAGPNLRAFNADSGITVLPTARSPGQFSR